MHPTWSRKDVGKLRAAVRRRLTLPSSRPVVLNQQRAEKDDNDLSPAVPEPVDDGFLHRAPMIAGVRAEARYILDRPPRCFGPSPAVQSRDEMFSGDL